MENCDVGRCLKALSIQTSRWLDDNVRKQQQQYWHITNNNGGGVWFVKVESHGTQHFRLPVPLSKACVVRIWPMLHDGPITLHDRPMALCDPSISQNNKGKRQSFARLIVPQFRMETYPGCPGKQLLNECCFCCSLYRMQVARQDSCIVVRRKMWKHTLPVYFQLLWCFYQTVISRTCTVTALSFRVLVQAW